jgi:Family of unknown function (DUF6352)
MNTAPDFWLSSGFHLLARDAAGRLVVTEDFLHAYLERPELRPVPESGPAERELHRALMAAPRRAVPAEQVAAIEDPDARENYRVLLGFRDGLLAEPTIESFYLSLFRAAAVMLPPLFVDQLVHVMLRNILDGCTDPMQLRAAELLFRRQRVELDGGAVMLADEEIVEMRAAAGTPSRPLTATAEPPRVELDVLDETNAAAYWARSDRFDMVIDVSFARAGLDALCRVLEAWVMHFLGAVVTIAPVQRISDERWAWHVGLDGEATSILNDLYDGRAVEEERLRRILSLFRLEFREPAVMLPRVAGRPVYVAMAMDERNVLRLKPQNLLVNLPLAGQG